VSDNDNTAGIFTKQLAGQLHQLSPIVEDLVRRHSLDELRETEKWMRTKIETIETIGEFNPDYKIQLKSQLFAMIGMVQMGIIAHQQAPSDTITFYGSIEGL